MAGDLIQVLRMVAADLGLEALAHRLGGDGAISEAEALHGIWLVDLERRDETVRLVLERDETTPFALARPWLTDARGGVYAAGGLLRLTGAAWVREQYTFTAPRQADALCLHLSAGAGRAGVDLPLPAARRQDRRAA